MYIKLPPPFTALYNARDTELVKVNIYVNSLVPKLNPDGTKQDNYEACAFQLYKDVNKAVFVVVFINCKVLN